MGPVDPETVNQAAAMLMAAMGIDPNADITPDTFASIAGLRDGLFDVVRALDTKLADFVTLEHYSHDETTARTTTPWCISCRWQFLHEDTPTTTLQRRWGS